MRFTIILTSWEIPDLGNSQTEDIGIKEYKKLKLYNVLNYVLIIKSVICGDLINERESKLCLCRVQAD